MAIRYRNMVIILLRFVPYNYLFSKAVQVPCLYKLYTYIFIYVYIITKSRSVRRYVKWRKNVISEPITFANTRACLISNNKRVYFSYNQSLKLLFSPLFFARLALRCLTIYVLKFRSLITIVYLFVRQHGG